MNLLSPSQVTALLNRHGLHPKKRLGQNFLIDRNILEKIIQAAKPEETGFALEVGPGLGTVTQALAEHTKKTVAVEADAQLIPVLEETLADYPHAEVVQADFLKLDLEPFLTERFGEGKISAVSNVPYYITSPIIIKLLEHKEHFTRIVLMVQKEVAQRLNAKAATDDFGALTVFVQYHCSIEVIANVSRNVFYPPPEVDSSLILLNILPEPSVKTDAPDLFFRVVRAAFGKRRKTIWNALTTAAGEKWPKEAVRAALAHAGIEEIRRGETLSLDEFAKVADALKAELA